MFFSEEEKKRYSRHFILEGFGEDAQWKLAQSRVLVVGAGGLGSPALLYLAAAGVGHIGIADNDLISLSNLQRQILYTTEDVGNSKAITAANRLAALNPNLDFISIPDRVGNENVLEIVKEYEVILDCTDNFSTRYLLNDACVILNKPLVYGAIYKFEGQVSVFNLGAGPTYRCLFPEAPTAQLSCSEVGVLGVLPGVIGMWQASEAIKIITGIGTPLSGTLLSFDLLENQINSFRFNAIASNKEIRQLGKYDTTCASTSNDIDALALQHWLKEKEVQLIDVREFDEYKKHNIGSKNIPLSTLEENINQINSSKLTVVHCQSGSRSKKAIDIIRRYFPAMQLFNLRDGLNGFEQK